MVNSRKDKNYAIEIHKEQYAKSEFEVRKKNSLEGLWDFERFLISENLTQPLSPTLEIGCGTGRISLGMESDFGFLNITATDFVDEYINRAKEIALERKSSVKFETCSATELPFENNSFQYVVCLGVVLSHLPNRNQRIQALKECQRVLKDGGVLLINTMNILQKKWYMPFLKFLTKVTRIFNNPYDYEDNCLPRLGTSGKFDPLFLRTNKPALYYYYPDELVFDLISSGFFISKLITTSNSLDDLENERFLHSGSNIYAVAKK